MLGQGKEYINLTSLGRSKSSSFKNWSQSFALSTLDFLFHSNVNIYTKIRVTGAIGGPVVQALPLLNVPFQYLPNGNSGIASCVLFSHRQPLGTKLPQLGKNIILLFLKELVRSFLLLQFWGGSTKTTVVKNVPQPIVWSSLLLVSWTGRGENV